MCQEHDFVLVAIPDNVTRLFKADGSRIQQHTGPKTRGQIPLHSRGHAGISRILPIDMPLRRDLEMYAKEELPAWDNPIGVGQKLCVNRRSGFDARRWTVLAMSRAGRIRYRCSGDSDQEDKLCTLPFPANDRHRSSLLPLIRLPGRYAANKR